MTKGLIRLYVRKMIQEKAGRLPMRAFPRPSSLDSLQTYNGNDNAFVTYSNNPTFSATSADPSYKVDDHLTDFTQGTLPDAPDQKYIHIYHILPSGQPEHIETISNTFQAKELGEI